MVCFLSDFSGICNFVVWFVSRWFALGFEFGFSGLVFGVYLVFVKIGGFGLLYDRISDDFGFLSGVILAKVYFSGILRFWIWFCFLFVWV